MAENPSWRAAYYAPDVTILLQRGERLKAFKLLHSIAGLRQTGWCGNKDCPLHTWEEAERMKDEARSRDSRSD